MCELLAISSEAPIRVKYSLHEFAKHGGLTHLNKSGWGISYYHKRDTALFREAAPASDSPLAKFIAQYDIPSRAVLAHVRRASVGGEGLENTHPFDRELGGRRHVFAHNGSLREIESRLPLRGSRFQPIGETDSEHAFCALLERINEAGIGSSVDERVGLIADFAAELRSIGTANFLYFDGDVLFAHAHKRRYDDGVTLGPVRAPGLHIAKRSALEIAGLDLAVDHDVNATILASVPLTDQGWTELEEGTILAIQAGEELARFTP